MKMNFASFRILDIDLISGLLFILGIYLVTIGNNFGWFLVLIAFLKQFRGR